MSKSYRYDPEAESGRGCGESRGDGGWRRGRRRGEGGKARSAAVPETPTLEWAVAKMGRHIEFEAERLVTDGIIPLCEKEDAMSVMRVALIAALPRYDAERVAQDGETCGIVHFLTVVVDNAMHKMRRFHSRLCRTGETIPLPAAEPDGAGAFGPDEGSPFFGRCRSVRVADFRMDVETLRGMLTAVEREAFDLLLEEQSYVAIAKKFGISESWFRRSVLSGIRRKAVKCGFVPASKKNCASEGGFCGRRVIDVGGGTKKETRT